MSLIHRAVAALVLLIAPAAWADTIVAGSPIQQTTCEYCFFPLPIVTYVYTDAGQPKAGATVTFNVPSQDVAFIPNAGLGPYTVVTDGNGAARLPTPGLIPARGGNFTVTATTPGAASPVTFNLTADGSPPTRIYNAQYILGGVVNTQYADQFVVGAYGDDNLPRPNAAIIYAPVAGGASGSFVIGGDRAYAQAGPTGLAYAPYFLANEIAGQGEILVATFNPAATHLVIPHYNSAAGVAFLEPTAGSTPQSARLQAAFPVAIGAIARDAAGNPVRNAAIRFESTFADINVDGFAFWWANDSGNIIWLLTDANGRAEVSYPLVVSNAGPVTVKARTPALAAPLSYDLQGLGGAATTLQYVSGNNQRAIVNTAYSAPWVVRAVGADGLPVPYAAVQFRADSRPGFPSGTFPGSPDTVMVVADAAGVARSPILTANSIVGSGFGQVVAGAGAYTFFYFENLSAELSVQMLPYIPTNAPVGGSTPAGFTAQVTNTLGAPAAGASFTYQVDPTCGRLLGSTSYSGVTGVDGLAIAPPMQAIAPSLSCLVSLQVAGAPYAVGVTVHNYDPATVVLTATPNPIDLVIPERLAIRLAVSVQADGVPVYAPNIAGAVTQAPNGATGVLTADRPPSFDGGAFSFILTGNTKQGNYEVIVDVGPVRLVVPVRQRKN